MKKIVVFALAVSCSVSSIAQQWKKKLTLRFPEGISHISAVSDRVVWVHSSFNNFIISKDGGSNWTRVIPQGLSGNYTFQQLWALDSSVALLTANTNYTGVGPGIIFRTTDGGKNWAQVFSHVDNCDFQLYFSSRKEGRVAFNYSKYTGSTQQTLFATHDGGATWDSASITNPVNYYSIGAFFVKDNKAWLNSQNNLYYSEDLCKTWSASQTPANASFNIMRFETNDYGIANSTALIDLYVKRPPKIKWQRKGDPTNFGGAVVPLLLNGKECWFSTPFDLLGNFYSSDSCRTFTAVIIDSSTAFFFMQKSWNGKNTWGATLNTLYVSKPVTETEKPATHKLHSQTAEQ